MANSEALQELLPNPRYPLTRYNSGVLLGWYFRVEALMEIKWQCYMHLFEMGYPSLEACIEYSIVENVFSDLGAVLKKRGEL